MLINRKILAVLYHHGSRGKTPVMVQVENFEIAFDFLLYLQLDSNFKSEDARGSRV